MRVILSDALGEHGNRGVSHSVHNDLLRGPICALNSSPAIVRKEYLSLEASKQSRLRAWNVLQRLRLVLSKNGKVAIPSPAQKTFDAEGEILEHALTKSFRVRNEAIKSLCSSVRRFRDATIKEKCKSDYPQALQALWKALDRMEDLIQD